MEKRRLNRSAMFLVVLPALVAFVALLAGSTLAEEAENTPAGASQGESSALMQAVDRLAMEGYLVSGPGRVLFVDNKKLQVYRTPRPLTIMLTEKNVTVYDAQLNPTGLRTLTPSSWVYVCRKKDKVVVFVTVREGKNDDQG
jgi:hypothetical protein